MPKIVPAFGDRRFARHPVAGVDLGEYTPAPDLGAQAGLTRLGIHIEILHPGTRSSLRHWHEGEDEFVYVLAGRLTLIEDEDTELHAGEAAGWAAGVPVGHCLENRTQEDATILVVGTRSPRDVWHYVEHGLVGTFDRGSGTVTYAREDGTPIEKGTP